MQHCSLPPEIKLFFALTLDPDRGALVIKEYFKSLNPFSEADISQKMKEDNQGFLTDLVQLEELSPQAVSEVCGLIIQQSLPFSHIRFLAINNSKMKEIHETWSTITKPQNSH